MDREPVPAVQYEEEGEEDAGFLVVNSAYQRVRSSQHL